MLPISPEMKLPELQQKELTTLTNSKLPEFNMALAVVADSVSAISKSQTPSKLHAAYIEGLDASNRLQHLSAEIVKSAHALSADSLHQSSQATQEKIKDLESSVKFYEDCFENDQKRSNDSTLKKVATGAFLSILFPLDAIEAAIYTAREYSRVSSGAKTYKQEIAEQFASCKEQLSSARSQLHHINLQQADFKIISDGFNSKTFFPSIFLRQAEHADKIYSEVEKVCSSHHTTPDTIADYLKMTNPEILTSFLALLKGRYSVDDLTALKSYAQSSDITASQDQRTLLQFINHSVIPHLDYFEIWASKTQDLQKNLEHIQQALEAGKTGDLPKLEILGQTGITLSGTIEPKAPALAISDVAIQAEDFGAKSLIDARDQVRKMVADLYDEGQGDLKSRHNTVKKKALAEIEKFNGYFGGVEKALDKIHAALGQTTSRRDRTWQQFLGVEAINNQIDLQNFNSPEAMRSFNRKVLWASTAPMVVINPEFGVSDLIGGEIRNALTNARYQEEWQIRIKSLLARKGGDSDQLKASIDELDREIKKLSEDKEFNNFLVKSGAVENVRAIYMLLPRLVAGESNIAVCEEYCSEHGYAKLDEFVEELKTNNPRLGLAIEKFLFGFANTNDLEVILADSNSIEEPDHRCDKVLVNYVEQIIKPNFADISRQASVIDHLQMRNALYVGNPLHSFGEVVRMETDIALQALFAGQGAFSLIGSNDIHQLFSHYLTRHGEETFVDLHNRGIRKPKVIELANPSDLHAKNREVISARYEDTALPRQGSIFLETCAHEYLLSQGVNIVKNRELMKSPQALGVFEMVNAATADIVRKTAMDQAWKQARGSTDTTNNGRIGALVEGLIADSCVQFFSELGAMHREDSTIQEKQQMVKNAYAGGNMGVAHAAYAKAITGSAAQNYGLFLKIYKQTCEAYLKPATRENKAILLAQLEVVRDTMKDLQIDDKVVTPGSETDRLRAHYRNHSLANVGHNYENWSQRAAAICGSGKQII